MGEDKKISGESTIDDAINKSEDFLFGLLSN